MGKTKSAQYTINDKTLNVYCVVLNDGDVSDNVLSDACEAFEKLAPFVKNENQVLYIRDIPFLSIKNKYPGGHCYNPNEAMIALKSWQDDGQQIKAAINHELHHMARWQNAGYGETLGGAILSEGIATYYEELQSGWLAPWADATISNETLQAALDAWDDANYNHAEWFFEGPQGEWIGYGMGYRLAKIIFKDGFDLAKSVEMATTDAREYAQQMR